MMLPPDNIIQSMLAVEHLIVLMGTTSGNLFVYDGRDRKLRHQLARLDDSILTLMYFRYGFVFRVFLSLNLCLLALPYTLKGVY